MFSSFSHHYYLYCINISSLLTCLLFTPFYIAYKSSSLGRIFYKKVTLKNFVKITENICNAVLFLVTMQAWLCILNKGVNCRCFFVSFTKFLKNSYSIRQLWTGALGSQKLFQGFFPTTRIYLFKVTNKNTSKRCQICSKFKVIDVFLLFLSLTLNIFHTFF